MNLGRATLILIVAFTGLNIFLGYQLFWPDFGRLRQVAITSDQLQATERMLKDNNYVLEASFERAKQTSFFLTVSPDRDIKNDFLDYYIKAGVRINKTDNTTYYQSEEKTVLVHANGLIQVFYKSGAFLIEDTLNLEIRVLKNLVEEFLNNKGLLPEEYVFDYLEINDNNEITIHYYQAMNGMPIYSGQFKVIIENDHITAINIYWLQPVETIPYREMEVISATEALNNLVTELGASTDERTIKEIDLGYFSGEYDAEKWEIPPVWRIVLDGDQKYYINAFTGNLENNAVIPDQ